MNENLFVIKREKNRTCFVPFSLLLLYGAFYACLWRVCGSGGDELTMITGPNKQQAWSGNCYSVEMNAVLI